MSDEHLPSLPSQGDLIGGRFRIAELVGSGGFGTVYRAVQENVGRDVALKFLAPSVAKDPVNIERFRREAFHVSQLRHPNTITLYDYGQTDSGLFYMVMELLQGVALSDEIQRDGAIEQGRAAHILLQVLKSLSEAHQRGLVHRDLKPENIYLCEMFGEQDYVKVLDFGVAKMTMMEGEGAADEAPKKLTRAGRIFGTPMYMAPEQACAEPITPATDIYALGLLLFEVLTGLPPVTGRNRMDVIHKQIREEVPHLTPELKGTPIGDVIRRATKKDPEARYQDAAQMWGAFYEAIRQMRVVPAPRGASLPDISVMSLGLSASSAPERSLEPSVPQRPAPISPPVAVTQPPVPPPLPEIGDEEDEDATHITPLADPLAITASRRRALSAESAASPPQQATTSEQGALQEHTQVAIQALSESMLKQPSASSALNASDQPPQEFELPLIGRDAELASLKELVTQRVAERRGHIVLLEGESGVGKTRAVWALREALFQIDLGLCVGACRQGGQALDALREALADYWWVSNAPRARVEQVIGQDLRALGFPQEEIAFLIDFLTSSPHTSLDLSDEASEEEEDAITSTLFARLERIILMLAALRPFIIVLEDIQEADSTTLAFLEYLAVSLRAQPAPVVLMLTLRSVSGSTHPDLERSLRAMSANVGVGLSRVRLKRLRGRELSVLLDAILPMESRLKERVAWLSQGNPLHAIQIVRYLRSSQRLKQEQDRWAPKEGVARQIELPPDLMDLMQLRVAQAVDLNPNAPHLRETITWVAILGIRVPIALLASVMRAQHGLGDEALKHNVAVLHRFGIAHDRVHREVACVEFDNSLLRESLLQKVASDPERASMHAVAAEAKMAYAASVDQEAPLLEIAEHWRLASDAERYRDALFEAAQRSMRRRDPRGAREQFRELLRLLEARGERGQLWAESLMALAELSWRFGELGLSEDNYKRVLDARVLKGDALAKAERGMAHLLVMLGRYPEAVRHYRAALTAANAVEDQPSIAKALVGLSSVHLRQNSESSAGDQVRARLEAMLPTLGDDALAGKVLLHLAESAKRLGQMAPAEDYLERALERYKGSSDRHGLSDCMIAFASILMVPAEDAPSRLQRAEALLKEALEIKRTTGDRHGVAEVFRHLGGVAQVQDNMEQAEDYLRQSLKMHEALGALFHMGAACNSLGVCKMYTGDFEVADALFEDAIRCFDRVGDQLAVSHAMLNKGTLAINRGALDEARALLEETRELKERLESTWGLYDLYNHLALLAMARGEFALAENLLANTLESLTETQADEDKTIARSLLGLLRCLQGRLQLAALELGRARGDAEEMGDARISALCQANAMLYASITGADHVYNDLLALLLSHTSMLYSLSVDTWLELLDAMAHHAMAQERSPLPRRLAESIVRIAGDLNRPERVSALSETLKSRSPS